MAAPCTPVRDGRAADDGVRAGFPIEVFNVLGAGDAFMAGFLSRLAARRAARPSAASDANACGALVVSRHGCAPAMPTGDELEHFLAHGSADAAAARGRRAGSAAPRRRTRASVPPLLAVLAFDHRAQFEEMADQHGRRATRIAEFKRLIAPRRAARASTTAGRGRGGGLILDDRYGEVAAAATGRAASGSRGRSKPGPRPLAFEDGENVAGAAAALAAPARREVPGRLRSGRSGRAAARADRAPASNWLHACVATEHELLLEIMLPADARGRPVDRRLRAAMAEIVEAGVLPDWWKLPAPADDDGWHALSTTVHLRSIRIAAACWCSVRTPARSSWRRRFALAARHPICRGFAVGRTIFGDAARAWFAGSIDDAAVDRASRVALRRADRAVVRLEHRRVTVGDGPPCSFGDH